MNASPISFADLVPKETSFKLDSKPNKEFTLRRWSLRVRMWAEKRYTSEGLKTIFEKLKLNEIAEMAWYMLKDEDKVFFEQSEEKFFEEISSTKDQVAIITAMLGSVGIGEPEIKKINDSIKKKTPYQNPAKKIGAKSTTP